jgi:molybdopterin biosynthesis enzyme MoaB
MMGHKLRAAILIVSTTASQDPTTDAAENALRSVFEQDGAERWHIVEAKIVPDSVALIQRQLMLWTDAADPVNLAVTTGGTGFAVSDQTPEVISENAIPHDISRPRSLTRRMSRLCLRYSINKHLDSSTACSLLL